MSEYRNHSGAGARRSDYVLQYEYYDDEEPISYEGLKAHRYSIVIGFWVGLAVFVIFMFFVLTLLTKTGAPHQENPEPVEKRHRPGSCQIDVSGPQEEINKAFTRPLLGESRSFFHFYISEEETAQGPRKPGDRGAGREAGAQTRSDSSSQPEVLGPPRTERMGEEIEEAEGLQPLRGLMTETKSDQESAFLFSFNIPNFVNSEHGSMLE